MVPNTTFSTNSFSDSFDGLQAFGYDLWRTTETADRILPLPDQFIDRQYYIMARVMCAVATIMTLTDGTQRLILRVPEHS